VSDLRLRLGKKPATEDVRDFKFANLFAGVTMPTPPNRFGHGTLFHSTEWQMYGNGPDDTVEPGFGGCGDCVFAGAAHEVMLTNKIGGHPVPKFTGKNVVSDYSAVTGYVVGDDQTDQGTDVRQALSYRRKTGVVDAAGTRHKIGAYVSIAAKNWDELMEAVYVFSAVGIGFEFPSYAMDQFDQGQPWDVVDPNAQIEGGHYVPVVGRSSKNVAGVVTWGRRQGMTREFYETYNDEAWAIVYPEELRAGTLKNERGFDLSALNQALASLH
jgi:hypothetical protein